MQHRIADRLSDFDSGKIRQAFELADEIPNQIDLSIGFPEEDTPENVKQAGIAAIQQNHTKYLPTNGLGELREAIANKLRTENHIDSTAANVTVTPGLTTATQSMFGAWVNAAGLSGISVPGQPHPDGRPIGVQIVAPFGHDAVVLEIAQRLETRASWTDRWPPLALTV